MIIHTVKINAMLDPVFSAVDRLMACIPCEDEEEAWARRALLIAELVNLHQKAYQRGHETGSREERERLLTALSALCEEKQ